MEIVTVEVRKLALTGPASRQGKSQGVPQVSGFDGRIDGGFIHQSKEKLVCKEGHDFISEHIKHEILVGQPNGKCI